MNHQWQSYNLFIVTHEPPMAVLQSLHCNTWTRKYSLGITTWSTFLSILKPPLIKFYSYNGRLQCLSSHFSPLVKYHCTNYDPKDFFFCQLLAVLLSNTAGLLRPDNGINISFRWWGLVKWIYTRSLLLKISTGQLVRCEIMIILQVWDLDNLSGVRLW